MTIASTLQYSFVLELIAPGDLVPFKVEPIRGTCECCLGLDVPEDDQDDYQACLVKTGVHLYVSPNLYDFVAKKKEEFHALYRTKYQHNKPILGFDLYHDFGQCVLVLHVPIRRTAVIYPRFLNRGVSALRFGSKRVAVNHFHRIELSAVGL